MRNINLNFIGIGNIEVFVKIYNSDNLIYQGKTNSGRLSLFLKKNKTYKIKAMFLSYYLDTVFYVNNYKNDYNFIFGNILYNTPSSRDITFLLTDYYYDNLKIEKGEMILWPK